MNEHTVEIVEIIAGLVATIVTGCFTYKALRWKYISNKKKKSQESGENDELAKAEEIIAEYENKEEEDSFINRIVETDWFEEKLCELMVSIPCDVITLFVPVDNIEFGISLKYESQNKDTILKITHECKKDSPNVTSEKERHKDILLGHYRTNIVRMEQYEKEYKGTFRQGMIVVNKESDLVDDPALQAVFEYSEKKSAICCPVYRPQLGHRPRYMMAVIIIGTVIDEYTWTDKDMKELYVKGEIIGERIDGIYEKFAAKEIIEA